MERTDAGQHTEERYFIYVMHNAVVRLDVMVCHIFIPTSEDECSPALAMALELYWQGIQ